MVDEPETDCPICLDPMTEAGLVHPLQCARKCGYNFCLTCIESLITSSKDDFAEASDGNMHVKVYLNCPNCRSDLGPTIRDTLLLRKADNLKYHLTNNPDGSELTESELRLKKVINDPDVRSAISDAREREAAFFGKKFEEEGREIWDSVSREEEQEYQEEEEMGIEADLDGVHGSFRCHTKEMAKKLSSALSDYEKLDIDSTLFGGLEWAMTEGEKYSVTELLTSGSTDKLAEAAEMMHVVAQNSRDGVTPNKRGVVDRRSSVFALIADSKMAKQKAEAKAAIRAGKVADVHRRAAAGGPKSAKERAAQHRAVDLETRRQIKYMQMHPLPVRMPKYAEFSLHEVKGGNDRPGAGGPGGLVTTLIPFALAKDGASLPLTFVDDVWDGSVIDAYSKITVGRNKRVTKKKVSNRGVENVVGRGAARIDTEHGRVVVASVGTEARMQGVMKGDVVTHFNGEEFKGDAAELERSIKKFAEDDRDADGDGFFQIVLNAGPSIAEALKRRAMIIEN